MIRVLGIGACISGMETVPIMKEEEVEKMVMEYGKDVKH
jgi:hypothetical protein